MKTVNIVPSYVIGEKFSQSTPNFNLFSDKKESKKILREILRLAERKGLKNNISLFNFFHERMLLSPLLVLAYLKKYEPKKKIVEFLNENNIQAETEWDFLHPQFDSKIHKKTKDIIFAKKDLLEISANFIIELFS